MRFSAAVFVVSGLLANAHPGEHHEEEGKKLLLARQEHQAAAARGLQACQSKRSYQAVQARAVQRRAAAVNLHRKVKRVDQAGTGHNLTDSRTEINADSDDAVVFGDSHTCILNPEGETGPYYVKGELIRQDLREDQPGVPIVIDGQFIDVETCEPITNLYWDIWNCNSTGVYSGLIANGNGNTADTSNLDATFLRGIQETNEDGVVQFLSVFPGHYSGRTTHHHMVAWIDATVADNNTLTSGHAAHIGQVFWDQDIINTVEATYPYSTNTISITENADDRVVGNEVANTDSDPFFSYVYLGDSLEDGLFGWITIGINTSATYSPNYSFEYTEGGGVALEQQVGTDNVNGGSPMTGGGIGGGPPGQTGAAGNGTAGATATTTTTSSTTATGTTSASASSTASSSSSTSAGRPLSSAHGMSLFVAAASLLVGALMFTL